MNIWGKEDNANSAPNFIVESSTGKTGRELYGEQVFLRNSEWVREVEGTGGRANRLQKEVLVTFASIEESTPVLVDYEETLTGTLTPGYTTVVGPTYIGYGSGDGTPAIGSYNLPASTTPLTYEIRFMIFVINGEDTMITTSILSNAETLKIIVDGISFDIEGGQGVFEATIPTTDLVLQDGETVPFVIEMTGAV